MNCPEQRASRFSIRYNCFQAGKRMKPLEKSAFYSLPSFSSPPPHFWQPKSRKRDRLLFRRNTWIDIQCSFRLCTVCNFSASETTSASTSTLTSTSTRSPSSAPRLRLRGLCSLSAFDSHYTLVTEAFHDGKHYFRGFYGSQIRWSQKQRMWTLNRFGKLSEI